MSHGPSLQVNGTTKVLGVVDALESRRRRQFEAVAQVACKVAWKFVLYDERPQSSWHLNIVNRYCFDFSRHLLTLMNTASRASLRFRRCSCFRHCFADELQLALPHLWGSFTLLPQPRRLCTFIIANKHKLPYKRGKMIRPVSLRERNQLFTHFDNEKIAAFGKVNESHARPANSRQHFARF